MGKLNVKGKIKPIRGFANPGSFDTEMAAKVQGIGGRMSAKEAEQVRYIDIQDLQDSYPAAIGGAMRTQLKRVMPPKRCRYSASGMTLGGYEGII